MTLSLQTKRDHLHASLEQLVGQINRTNGAIAVLDELLKEEAEKREREAAAQEAERAAWPLKATTVEPEPLVINWPVPATEAPRLQPEMLAVVKEFEACEMCVIVECEEQGRCALLPRALT